MCFFKNTGNATLNQQYSVISNCPQFKTNWRSKMDFRKNAWNDYQPQKIEHSLTDMFRNQLYNYPKSLKTQAKIKILFVRYISL